MKKRTHGLFWELAYLIVPPIQRTLEKMRFHTGRQPFIVGRLKNKNSIEEVKMHLSKQGFEPVMLAWRDENEALSMRRIHNKIFQHHVRIHHDGEVRAHHEYSSEGRPFYHLTRKEQKPQKEFFVSLLRNHLK